MKTLFLIRHAKSDWSASGLLDIDRPLNIRGYSDAHRIGTRLEKIIAEKTLFASSPAIRAISTALIIARETNYPQNKIQLFPELYNAEPEAYEKVITSIGKKYDSIFIFGHNPTITNVIGLFTNTNIVEVPTCSVSVIKFNADDWSAPMISSGVLESQIFPKLLIG